ncbi:MAG: transposase [Opitutaceae bacterium]|nr:transposase [Cytophagales bacterium]
MVYKFIKDGSIEYPIETLCKTLSVSRSAYYAYARGSTYQVKSEKVKLADKIRDEFATHKKRYGTRRISKSLKQHGISIGRYAIRSQMRVQGPHAIQPRSLYPKLPIAGIS